MNRAHIFEALENALDRKQITHAGAAYFWLGLSEASFSKRMNGHMPFNAADMFNAGINIGLPEHEYYSCFIRPYVAFNRDKLFPNHFR